ncbi:MAG: DUF4255 domain-containing protein [Thaumarchaeota archaeon]|nr:DUF4255 domain-containing protein [Nitrososphaerota archaeon]MCL5317211.1 DUF4255 domain-containing protein [Nitrososphaerota archaeon]
MTVQSPEVSSESARLNIFLYQVTPNPGYRNIDLPARSYSGDLVQKQQIGLDLHYLFTAYGDKNEEFSAQKIIADVIGVLHENPFLGKDLIYDTITAEGSDVKSQLPDIDHSDLADQIELVKITMQTLSLEELTKIWSSFFKTASYRLSVAYKATVVLIDGKKEAVPTMPVRDRTLNIISPKQPEITGIDPQMVTWDSSGMEIAINGKDLKADDVRLDFGEGVDVDSMPTPKSVSNEKLVAEIPASSTVGIKQVTVIHPLSIGIPETPHKGPISNTALFAVVPTIKSVTAAVKKGEDLAIEFEPEVEPDQGISVIIGRLKPLKMSSEAAAAFSTISVTIPEDFDAGTYPVRLRVDGAESQPTDTIANDYHRPTVTITD